MRIGCFIIHGFGGNIEEVAPLIGYLNEKGLKTLCPVLKGHTGKRKDFAASTYEDWIRSAETGLQEFLKDCDRVILIGFSMGGLIAVNLAKKYEVFAIITLNTPIYHWDLNKIVSNLRSDLKNKDLTNLKRYLKAAQNSPFPALINFKMLLRNTKPLLKEIKCPILIIQALEDDTTRIKSAEFILKNVASGKKKIIYYPNSGHLICRSLASKEVFMDVSEFIKTEADTIIM